MAHSNHFDVIVIGSGPGGEGAAMGLTKAGLNVAIIEKESRTRLKAIFINANNDNKSVEFKSSIDLFAIIAKGIK